MTTPTHSRRLCVSSEAGVNSVYCVGEGGQRDWVVTHSDLCLPEYIVNVRYFTSTLLNGEEVTPELPVGVADHTHPLRLAMLDEATLLERAGAHNLASVKVMVVPSTDYTHTTYVYRSFVFMTTI